MHIVTIGVVDRAEVKVVAAVATTTEDNRAEGKDGKRSLSQSS